MKRGIFILICCAMLAGSVSACPMCKDSIPNSDSSNPAAVGPAFNYSVYLMLGAFLSVLGLVGAGIVRAIYTSGRPVGRGFEVGEAKKKE